MPNTLRRRKILQEMHFKPSDQAGLPNFASDKTKPVTTRKRPGKTWVAEWYKREDTVRLQKGEYGVKQVIPAEMTAGYKRATLHCP